MIGHHVPSSTGISLVLGSVAAVFWVLAFGWYWYGFRKLEHKLGNLLIRLKLKAPRTVALRPAGIARKRRAAEAAARAAAMADGIDRDR